MAERNFATVLSRILHACPGTELYYELNHNCMYWAPEICWEMLSQYVNKYLKKDSSSKVSVKVYSCLTGKSKLEIRRQFRKYGY